MGSFLITTDLHLSDKPQDEYRFGIFSFLNQKAHHIEAIYILGDLTEKKDRHSAKLVNRIVNEINNLAIYRPVYILRGNHDGVDENCPFFSFLTNLKNVRFITKPEVICHPFGNVLMVPHQRENWPDLDQHKGKIHYAMLHQTVEGAIAESGARLNGLSTAPLKALGAKKVFSGDIHRPQVCGPVEYVGAPYNVRFGDDFVPRVIYVDDIKNKQINLHFPAPRKHTLKIRSPEDIELFEGVKAGDHVKVQLELAREELVEYHNLKRDILSICATRKLQVFGVELLTKKKFKRVRLVDNSPIRSNKDVFGDFCRHERLTSAIREAGLAIIED